MTMPIQFDTLKYARLLKEGGLPSEQAELHAEALATVMGACQVAVESDLVLQRSDLLARMDLLKQEIYSRIDAVEIALGNRIDALELAIAALDGKFKAVYALLGVQFLMTALVLARLYS